MSLSLKLNPLIIIKCNAMNSSISNHRAYYSMTKLCHCREQDTAGWEGIPVYDGSREEAVFIVVCRGAVCLLASG